MRKKKEPSVTVQCIGCKKKEVIPLKDERIKRANDFGLMMCSCGMPMVVKKVEAGKVEL